VKLTYYGQSCFSVVIMGKHILFDPFITGNELAKHIDVDQIPADYILISHGHGDHIADTESIAKRTKATCVSNFEIINWLASKGCLNGHPMNHGGSWSFDFGRVKLVNAIHSSVLPDGTGGGNPGGFVITSAEGNFYFAGDTALTMDMQLIPKFARLDFAVLPIGDNFTMGYQDALMAAEMVGCKKIVGVHYDTFGYIRIDHQAALACFGGAGYNLLLPGIGETIEV